MARSNSYRRVRQYADETGLTYRDALARVQDMRLNESASESSSSGLAPKDHQSAALDDIFTAMEVDGVRGKVVMPPRTGKTMLPVWLAQRQGDGLSVVFVHGSINVREMARRFARSFLGGVSVLVISKEFDSSSLRDPGAGIGAFECRQSLKASDISEFVKHGEGSRVLVVGYGSAHLLLEAMQTLDRPAVDLMVFDDAHHLAEEVGKKSAPLLREKVVRVSARIFVTATPTIRRVKNDGSIGNGLSMDNALDFGSVIHHLGYEEAIKRSLLRPFRLEVVSVTEESVAQAMSAARYVKLAGVERARATAVIAAEIACCRAVKELNLKRLLAFHRRIENSKDFVSGIDALQAGRLVPELTCGLEARHLDFEASDDQKAELLKWFSDPSRIPKALSNPRLLEDAGDLVGVDALCIVDTSKSEGSLLRAIGRVLQPSPGASVGTIILPVVVRNGESQIRALQRSEHRKAFELIVALTDLDPALWNRVRVTNRRGDSHVAPTESVCAISFSEVDLEYGEVAAALGIERVPVQEIRHANSKSEVAADPRQAKRQMSGAASVEERDLAVLTAAREYVIARGETPGPGATHLGVNLWGWWQEALERWEAGSLDEPIRRATPQAFSWALVDEDTYPTARREMLGFDRTPVRERVLHAIDQDRIASPSMRRLASTRAPIQQRDLEKLLRLVPESLPSAEAARACELYVKNCAEAMSATGNRESWRAFAGFVAAIQEGAIATDWLAAKVPSRRLESNAACHRLGEYAAKLAVAGVEFSWPGVKVRSNRERPSQAKLVQAPNTHKNSRRKQRHHET